MFSRLTSGINGFLSFFYSAPQSSSPIFDDSDCSKVDELEEKKTLGLSEAAINIYKALKQNGYNSYVRAESNSWAAKAESLCMTRSSKHPGSLVINNKVINFSTADYFINIEKNGEVKYQVKIKNAYYPIAIENIPDPTIKNIHTRVIQPLLNEKINSSVKVRI